MSRVKLEETDVYKDQISLMSTFMRAAFAQGFDAEWAEGVLDKAVANNCVNFTAILMEYIEIIPAQSKSQPGLEL